MMCSVQLDPRQHGSTTPKTPTPTKPTRGGSPPRAQGHNQVVLADRRRPSMSNINKCRANIVMGLLVDQVEVCN